ncbi:MAG TPA: RluA family pseudouridine synthase [Pyrinomonadaceae bacterium]|nr:RluA family pseudouridine synthase [Pyrinomonadaceae bacterium]
MDREAFAEASEENESLCIVATAEDAGARLDAFLAAHVSRMSRTALKRLIEDGEVLVSGRAAKASHRLRAGEEVEVELVAPPPLDLAPEDLPLDIVYEDEDLVVVNKPAGMVVHPGAGVARGTLANALAFRFARLSQRGGALRPGIVHRLDRDTSGLVVVAKTAHVHERLSEQFRARTVFKSYVALVHGRVTDDAGSIAEPIARSPRNRTQMAVRPGGRAALSLYRVRRRYERFTLLDVEIKTGRTHQIRVHLAWLKHPVVGDETYGGGRDRAVADASLRVRIQSLGRHFLHAARLAFDHPRTGERAEFDAPLPRELAELLAALE